MSAQTPSERVRAVAHVSGRVQAVGFRWWTMYQARALDVSGSAVNLADGRVEVQAEGAQPAVEALLDKISEGPPSARVDDVQTRWEEPTGRTGFRVG